MHDDTQVISVGNEFIELAKRDNKKMSYVILSYLCCVADVCYLERFNEYLFKGVTVSERPLLYKEIERLYGDGLIEKIEVPDNKSLDDNAKHIIGLVWAMYIHRRKNLLCLLCAIPSMIGFIIGVLYDGFKAFFVCKGKGRK